LVLNKRVDVQSFGQDRYGRVLGVVTVDRKDFNIKMVKAGFAEVHRGEHAKGFDPSTYIEAERGARFPKKGMRVQGEMYVSPRDWRRM